MARRKSIPFEGGCGDPGVGTDRGLVGFGVWWALPSPGGAAQKLCLCLDPQQTQPRLQRGIFVREKCDEKMLSVLAGLPLATEDVYGKTRARFKMRGSVLQACSVYVPAYS